MTYNMMVSLQDRVPTSLGGCWKQEPVTHEDALGRVFPIPLELIDSWMVSKGFSILRPQAHVPGF